ncbi:sulfite exporter TauE/SafE family protein [Alicyclobacillus mengziensis]|uniref:Probable membrane transporter protein n=1 Tax=Alicyclobacillus mengziensis TaxID=2931921 RepID=A0A9X7VYH1_9BACL|nr:sulfite exporter TauE/SafE family protein [Alicyclobacillus mengziensis]QSO46058.1 sulfite exporter TauE/SafE family protein [Alicyclobacillus mengziensis]
MSIGAFLTLLCIGLLGSFVSGMVGIGGSIVKYPLLLYVPPLLGVAEFSSHQVSGISAVQVLFSTAAGVFAYRKGNYLNYRLIAYMGAAIVVGSFIGAYEARYLSENAINLVYAFLATIAAAMMFIRTEERMDDQNSSSGEFNRVLVVILAGTVGLLSGVVGAAGAFLLVPLMLVVLKIPMRVTIASSLAITFISSIGATIGKLSAGDVLLGPSLVMIWASIVAAPLGARVGKRISVKWLKAILALLIVVTCVKIWSDMLHQIPH